MSLSELSCGFRRKIVLSLACVSCGSYSVAGNTFLICVFVGGRTGGEDDTCAIIKGRGPRTTLGREFSPSTVWLLKVELLWSGLVAGIFTY